MLKMTIVGRVSDRLPLSLAHGSRYVNEENNDGDISSHKQQAEFLLQEVSRIALPHSKMTIFLDDHCFNYIVENGMCFMALCDSMYPRKLAFCYLQDLYKEFVKFEDVGLNATSIRPYSLVKFGGVIANVRRKYVDTRSQANLSKINSDASQDADVISESFSRIVQRRRRSELFERISEAHLHPSPIWCSNRLEIIALKWIPIGLVVAVATLVIWTRWFHCDVFLIC
ncbi:25.3 kDa vesicle transport protein-like [Salvia splendens]|uniref:25.3 kDa vesicle transport protein-like n=1 Tax=Salvia splendens TaxID=180675 RepID=UPI001C274497|nr:25.3 kDa vesicle transport protein-like [Salvia splendens]